MARHERPLSPHLGIYRWQWSNTLSILHRATGVALSAGALLLTAWLVAMASGEQVWLAVASFLRSPVGMLGLGAITFCFFYHLCNGIRHLLWDAGYGFEIPRARVSGFVAVGGAGMLTLAFWLTVLS